MDSTTTDIDSYIVELRDGNYATKEKAARALEAAGVMTIKPLTEILRSCRREVKFYIINILGNIGGEEALAPLSWVAFGDNNHFFRRLAMLALGDTRNPKALPILMHGLEDESAHVRMAAGSSLGKLGSKQSLPALEKALATESCEQVIRKYQEAIGIIKANGKDTGIQRLAVLKKKACLGKELCEFMGEVRCPADNRKCMIKLKEEKTGSVASPETKKTPAGKRSKQPVAEKKKPEMLEIITSQEEMHTKDTRQKTDEMIRKMAALAKQTDAEFKALKEKYPEYFNTPAPHQPLKRVCRKR